MLLMEQGKVLWKKFRKLMLIHPVFFACTEGKMSEMCLVLYGNETWRPGKELVKLRHNGIGMIYWVLG